MSHQYDYYVFHFIFHSQFQLGYNTRLVDLGTFNLSLVVWQSNYHSCYYIRPVCPCQSRSSNINPAQQDSVWAQFMSSPSINMEFKSLWT